jgi:hypothetical protein
MSAAQAITVRCPGQLRLHHCSLETIHAFVFVSNNSAVNQATYFVRLYKTISIISPSPAHEGVVVWVHVGRDE